MQLIDTHAHLYLEQFDKDRFVTVKRAIDKGVSHILLPNIDENSIIPMLQMCDTFPKKCIPMIAIHPTSIKKKYPEQCDFVENQLNQAKYCAIGETGIDLYWDNTLFKEQCFAFEKHIELALKNDLPLVIHSRNSLDEIFNILKNFSENNLRGVFHCFPGDLKQAYKAIETGFMIGTGGVVTYKNSKMAKVVGGIDLKYILLETDAPYLAPMPKRGKRNESSYLIYVAETIAQIKNIDLAEVASVTTNNAKTLFKLNNF